MDTEKRPVLSGLIALVSVALVLGVCGGLALVMVAKSSGIGDEPDASASGTPTASLYLPQPSETSSDIPEPEEESPVPGASTEPTETQAPQKKITLAAAQLSVSPMQQIDLNGTYPNGEGSILQVQRMEYGKWSDFPVTVSVSGAKFATYVLTARVGLTKFRVIDTDSQTTSNPVTVKVG